LDALLAEIILDQLALALGIAPRPL